MYTYTKGKPRGGRLIAIPASVFESLNGWSPSSLHSSDFYLALIGYHEPPHVFDFQKKNNYKEWSPFIAIKTVSAL